MELHNKDVQLTWLVPDLTTEIALPLEEAGVSAGFPSPAGDYLEHTLDLNKELINHPSSTFYARVKGFSMKDLGICDGDILVVDKSLDPKDGDTVVCYIDGGFTVKTISIKKNEIKLIAANPTYPPIAISLEDDFTVWGVVTYNIQHLRNPRT